MVEDNETVVRNLDGRVHFCTGGKSYAVSSSALLASEGEEIAPTRCTVCRENYTVTGQQTGPIFEVWGKNFRVCRRCRAAGMDAKHGQDIASVLERVGAERDALKAEHAKLLSFIEGVMIVFRNYYAQAITRERVREKLDEWVALRAALAAEKGKP